MDYNLTLCVPRPSSGLNPLQPTIVRTPVPSSIPESHVLILVDRFGFSANNYTYQALGEVPHFRYFDFHAAPEDKTQGVSPKTHGLIPVWGFATVVTSTHPKIQEGERLYGYFAPTRYLLLPVASVNKYTLLVPRPHLPPDRKPYNQIKRCAADIEYSSDPAIEDLTMLYRPLFWTAFWCEDWLHSTMYRGATRVVISSASSKTAFCLAYLIRKRKVEGIQIIGMTSKGNVAFTKGLGLYDEVVEYSTFTEAPCMNAHERKFVYIDVSGNDTLNQRVFAHFAKGGKLVAGVALGLTNLAPTSKEAPTTNWSTNTFAAPFAAVGAVTSLEQFFMPEWLTIRVKQLSIPEITDMQRRAWIDLMQDCPSWIQLARVAGQKNVVDAYLNVAKGGIGPEKGYIWSLWEEGQQAKL